jgi:hypothetical protein
VSLFFGSWFYGSTPEAQARLKEIEARKESITITQQTEGNISNSGAVGATAFCQFPGLYLQSYPECSGSKQRQENSSVLIADKR